MIPSSKKRTAKVSQSKLDTKLDDGRIVQLTEHQRKLYELCRGVGKLPREMIERILSSLPKRTLLALKYVRGLRAVAFELVHRHYALSTEKTVVQGALILAGIGSALRSFTYHGHEPNHEFLAEVLKPEVLPALRQFIFSQCHSQPPIKIKHARVLIETLGMLPLLSVLNIHDGGDGDGLPLPELSHGLICDLISLHEQDRSILFPSLHTLRLDNASPGLGACLLSKHNPLQSLKRLALGNYRGYLYAEHFPSNLIHLDFDNCSRVGYADLLELLQRSQSTIESIYFDDGCERRCLDFVSTPVLECPRLQSMALQHGEYCCEGCRNDRRNDEEKTTAVPLWTRTAIGFHSRLVAPELQTLGIGELLMEPWTDGLRSLVESRKGTKLKSILCKHVVPTEPDQPVAAVEGEQAEEIGAQILLKANFDLASALLQETGIQLLCIGEEDYDDYFNDAFEGKLEL